MQTTEISRNQFIGGVNRFLNHHRTQRPFLFHESCCTFPDPPGKMYLDAYLDYVESQPVDQAVSVLCWDIPPAPADRYDGRYIARAFLDQMGDSPASIRASSMTLTWRLRDLLRNNPPHLLVITGWENLTSPRKGKLYHNQINFMKALLHTDLPHVPVLAIADTDFMDRIILSNEQLVPMFNDLPIN